MTFDFHNKNSEITHRRLQKTDKSKWIRVQQRFALLLKIFFNFK